jgi:membrane-associated phospholipid phosphatase
MLLCYSHRAAAIARASALILSIAPVAAIAQSGLPQSGQDSSARHTTLFTGRDAITAAAFVLGTAAIMPLDRHIAEESQRPGLQNNTVLNHAATTIRAIGEPGSIVLAGATYLYGRSEDSPASAELGLRTIESIGAAGVTSYIIKGFVGRARPFVTSDTNSHDFKAGRGFHEDDYTSFPSGHVTVAFAAATTASEEISYLWPHASHLWTPALYTVASLVGVARVYENKHWASDVIAGAAVGTLVSRIVVRYQRAHPRNALDRWLLPVGISETNGAHQMSLNWSYQF